MPVTRQEYLNKRNALVMKNVDQYTMDKLKMLYEKDINSTRRLSTINNIGSLIEVLEKRACVSEKDLSVLENITKEINVTATTSTKPVNGDIGIKPLDVTQKVHQEIISRIGRNWIVFARALDVQDGEIDSFYKNLYNNNPRECVEHILEFHKTNALSNDWKMLLLKALKKCRRRDLRDRVEYIFEHF